jgi:DNA-binding NtrC family response regulator
MPNETILVVDDSPKDNQLLTRFLEIEGYKVSSAKDGRAAMGQFKEGKYDLVLTDLKMPHMDGIELLKQVKNQDPNVIGVVVTGFATIDTAVEAMKVGAFDYVSKPYQLDEIRMVVQRALEYKRLQVENVSLKRELKRKYKFENIIGDHPRMQQVFRLIEKVADSESTVLIQGESGTGKELVAKAIHFNSNRRDRYIIPVNCGAIPENLLESELFGHVKGAFTGATTSRIGRFEAADGGTIFLDEIGDMSPKLQVKVLRVLQEQEFEPVGSTKTIKVSVRVIAATNQNLEELVEKKQFREDLFYRLNVIPINIPPLRERRSDIHLLVNHFLKTFCEEKGREVEPIESEVVQFISDYEWPGNVRELENLIERLVILNDRGAITVDDLPEKIRKGTSPRTMDPYEFPEEGLDFNKVVGEFENQIIRAALGRTRGNKNLAAKLLSLKRTTLVEKIKKKGLAGPWN